jgi:hypothetical protein
MYLGTRYIFFFTVVLFYTLLFYSCRTEDEFTTDTGINLRFSTDTVMFDTVFSQVGESRPLSITKQLWVVNTNEKGVRVNIRLKGTGLGVYKLNIDGVPASALSGKEIRGNDSIVIFIQAYINQQNQQLPFIVADQLLFETNGNTQDVDLVAWGQDAHYLNDSVLPAGNHYWSNDKPYVIYNSILVPQGATLTINQGSRIHSHIKSTIFVQGTLIVNGTKDKPVTFEGDRLDPEYRDNSSQWVGIRLLPRSVSNRINYAIIKNGQLGIQVDSVPVNNEPNLSLQNSIIRNMSAAGLVGYSSNIVAINNVIGNCGQFTFYGALGGDYRLYHNTFAAYNVGFNRQNPQFVLDNSPFKNEAGDIIAKFPLNFTLINNIIYGNQEEELILNLVADGVQTFDTRLITHNLIRTKLSGLPDNNVINSDPLFENVNQYNFKLKKNSPARGKGLFVNISKDIEEVNRSTTAPTIGAYE